ncbi:hypothetical protein SDC9_95164 [bioreactor metagenome]|uniref:Uncharacterized protein n=1 Tax=bioreactor metagenome TaxID=1076179 RepID=A0A645A5G9_9ZZZZ
MFYEPKTLIIVYKDEMLANQMKKLIETKDGSEGSVTGTTDNNINVVAWTEKVWLGNKKAGNINSKVLFLGDIKGVDKLIPVIDVKFYKHGIRYGWAGNQAVIYVTPNEIKSIESYCEFHKELEALPAPKAVKDAIKPKIAPMKESVSEEEVQPEVQEKTGFFAKGKSVVKKVGNTIGDAFAEVSAKALVFSEENFKNKKAMERQMLFFGVISLYNDGLKKFMNS